MTHSFAALAELCERLESTRERKSMTKWVASFISQIEPSEVEASILMLMGRVFPKSDQRTLEISWSTLSKTILKIAGKGSKSFSWAFRQTGDVGDAAKIVLEAGNIRKQSTLLEKQLTILEVRRSFESLAEATGAGSRVKKERLLETLIGSATPLEAKYLVKILLGEMRIGFQEGLMEVAVAEANNLPLELIKKASMLTGDLSKVAVLAKNGGRDGLESIGFQVFTPIKSMLASVASNVAEALRQHGGKSAFEYKLDGARIQIHKSMHEVRIFSRRLTDVTESLPEIVELIQMQVQAREAILEGEVIAVDRDGTPMAFQHLMRRLRRIKSIEDAANRIPVQLILFDALYVDGKDLTPKPYTERREKLANVAGRILLAEQIVTNDLETAERFLKEAVDAGHEGLMAKKLDSFYTPGLRGKKWFKIKTVLEPLDLVIVAAEYGYGRRHEWLSDYLLAARDLKTGELIALGKTFKGLTDEEIIRMTQRLKQLTIRKEGSRIIVKPEIVVEVTYNEIQKSPKYKGGMALRFARITNIRDDK
ncbi:MAG: ATP-dependent DNA ligase, partial [Candidatus Bathyarchaeota archaeon]|nr:ATP-dependent DNA ligase [Candidatus Bathyarchaeota archaeon]